MTLSFNSPNGYLFQERLGCFLLGSVSLKRKWDSNRLQYKVGDSCVLTSVPANAAHSILTPPLVRCLIFIPIVMKNERCWVFPFRMLSRQDLKFSNLTLETTIVTPLQFCSSDFKGAIGDSFRSLPVRLSSKTANRHFQKDCISSNTYNGYCHTEWS